MSRLKSSAKTLAHIKEREGLRLESYLCPAQIWTIGWGHTGALSGTPVKRGMRITQDKAELLFFQDVKAVEDQLDNLLIGVALTDHQYGVLVSFVFNFGIGALRRSTLYRLLQAGYPFEVPLQLLQWVRATVDGRKDVVLRGLLTRRVSEFNMWLLGVRLTPEQDSFFRRAVLEANRDPDHYRRWLQRRVSSGNLEFVWRD